MRFSKGQRTTAKTKVPAIILRNSTYTSEACAMSHLIFRRDLRIKGFGGHMSGAARNQRGAARTRRQMIILQARDFCTSGRGAAVVAGGSGYAICNRGRVMGWGNGRLERTGGQAGDPATAGWPSSGWFMQACRSDGHVAPRETLRIVTSRAVPTALGRRAEQGWSHPFRTWTW